MSDKRGIDRQYLLETLRNFDKEILSKKYTNNGQGTPGQNGITPHIGDNGNWFIGETDTNVSASGKDGKSITKITSDENNNLIVLFSDGSIQNIGSLSIDISADFLTEQGFGNLRYYNGKFQSFNGSEWLDTSVSPENVYVINMIPQTMKHICGLYDYTIGHYKLKFEEPDDTILDGQIACLVEKIIIRRKQNSEPIDESDGILVQTITKQNFGTYKSTWYIDETFSPNMGDKWYYKAFPVSTTGFVNISSMNGTGEMIARDYFLYGFRIDQKESNPDSMITYIEDNKKFNKAYMDFDADKFNYGDWRDVFFIPKQCMLKTDGTVDYYLKEDDVELRDNGDPSDVTNLNYDGNAMVEFPKIYVKFTSINEDVAEYRFSNKKSDDEFTCWSNIDENGNEIPHFYMRMYDGYVKDNKLRSISGYEPTRRIKTLQTSISYAENNNPSGSHMYSLHTYCDNSLIVLLSYLISRTTNCRTAFGEGNVGSYITNSTEGVKKTGATNKKGLFYGSKNKKDFVKIFGIENLYGNAYKICVGNFMVNGIRKIKLTYGKSDGSEVDGYNDTGDGYIEIPDSLKSGTSGGYLSKCKFTKWGIIPIEINGSASTYYISKNFYNNSSIKTVVVGSHSNEGTGSVIGECCESTTNIYGWQEVNGLSCKPPLAI